MSSVWHWATGTSPVSVKEFSEEDLARHSADIPDTPQSSESSPPPKGWRSYLRRDDSTVLPSLSPSEYLQTLFCSAVLSSLAYSNSDSDEEFATRLKGRSRSYSFFRPLNAQRSTTSRGRDFVFCELDSMLVVAFRGTENLNDWAINTEVDAVSPPELYGGAPVHKGFFASALGVPLEAAWRIASTKGKRLVFTGHSKGGAVAELAAHLSHVRFHHGAKSLPAGKPVACITFGQPHVLAPGTNSPSLRSHAALLVRRYIFSDDPVPLALNPLGFLPTGDFFCLKEKLPTEKLSRDAVSAKSALGLINSRTLEAHSMDRYAEALLAPVTDHWNDDIICSVGVSLVPLRAWWRKNVHMEAGWNGNSIDVVWRANDAAGHTQAWQFAFTQAAITLKTRSGDTVEEITLTEQPITKMTHIPTRKERNNGLVASGFSVWVKFSLPEDAVPDDGKFTISLSHSMHDEVFTSESSLDLRVVWFMGDSGAGKTSLVGCLEALAQHGEHSDEYKNRQELFNGASPSDDESAFQACGIYFRELLGARFHNDSERHYIFQEKMLECPPKLVVCVANARNKHASDPNTRQGLRYQAEALRKIIAEAAREAGFKEGEAPVGLCWAFTQWGHVPPAGREETEASMRDALGVAGDELVFKINSGKFELVEGHPVEVFGVKELLAHIRTVIPNQPQLKPPSYWKFICNVRAVAGALVRSRVGRGAILASGAALVAVALPEGAAAAGVAAVGNAASSASASAGAAGNSAVLPVLLAAMSRQN